MKSSSTAGPREPRRVIQYELGKPISQSLTVGVFHGGDFLVVIQVVQEWCEDPPAGIEFIVAYKVRVIAFERVQNERFIRFRNLEIREAAAIGEIQLGDDCLHTQAGQLGVHLDVDGFVGLYPDDEFVARNVLEDARSDVLELYSDLRLLLVEG